MRRAILTLAATLAVAAPAQAHTLHLSIHRARVAALAYVAQDVREGAATSGQVTTCLRATRASVRCDYVEQGVAIVDGVLDPTSELFSYVTVTARRHGHVTVDSALFTS